jgi:TonB family protein
MQLHRASLTALLVVTLCVFASLIGTDWSATASAQDRASVSSDRARGIELYEKGNDREAIKALQAATKQHPDDLTAWYYLGLTSERQRKTGDARKAYEKAAKLGDDLLTAKFNEQPNGSSLTLLKGITAELKQAAQSAAKYIVLAKPSGSKLYEWTTRADYLQDFAELSGPNVADRVFSSREVTTRVRVLAKPEPQYTEDARRHRVNGSIQLRCIFAADGRVRAIHPLKPLPNGLTLSAIAAAKAIRFVPATKDGQPVSMYMQLEYSFHIY